MQAVAVSPESVYAKMSDKVEVQSKLTDNENENVIPGRGSCSPLLKLDVDCFEELFEWLSLTDLLTLRGTCKRLQKLVDYFIKSKYPAVKIGYAKVELYQFHEPNSKLRIRDRKPKNNRDFDKFLDELLNDSIIIKMIKDLVIYVEFLTKEKIDKFKAILPHVEKLQIIPPNHLESDYYESILKWCSSLKCLRVDGEFRKNNAICIENQWLRRHYPSLEHFELDFNSENRDEIEELKILFISNPNIKILTTGFAFVLINRNWLLRSNIKINQLNLYGSCENYDLSQVCDVLNELHGQGFYERVFIDCDFIQSQTIMEQVTSVRGMEKLQLSEIRRMTPAPFPIQNLRKLTLDSDENTEDLEMFAKNLVGLQFVCFEEATLKTVEIFLLHVPRLKEIKVNELTGKNDLENGIINLVRLNNLRASLSGASKVTIYVEEKIYLSTKFALNSIKRNLITLRRMAEVVWE